MLVHIIDPSRSVEGNFRVYSVLTGDGMNDLFAAIQNHLASVEQQVELLLPHTAGAMHGEIRAKATVISEFYTEAGCLMRLQASAALLGRLLAEGARMAEPGDRPPPDDSQSGTPQG